MSEILHDIAKRQKKPFLVTAQCDTHLRVGWYYWLRFAPNCPEMATHVAIGPFDTVAEASEAHEMAMLCPELDCE